LRRIVAFLVNPCKGVFISIKRRAGRMANLRVGELAEFTNDFIRLPLVSTVEPHKLTVWADDGGPQP
jgi:hypothetical protein